MEHYSKASVFLINLNPFGLARSKSRLMDDVLPPPSIHFFRHQMFLTPVLGVELAALCTLG